MSARPGRPAPRWLWFFPHCHTLSPLLTSLLSLSHTRTARVHRLLYQYVQLHQQDVATVYFVAGWTNGAAHLVRAALTELTSIQRGLCTMIQL